jgi:hypothetical protein
LRCIARAMPWLWPIQRNLTGLFWTCLPMIHAFHGSYGKPTSPERLCAYLQESLQEMCQAEGREFLPMPGRAGASTPLKQ